MESVKASIEKTKYETRIIASGNQLIADESLAKGGQAKGFNPHELLASSLAACTSITLRMYADHKEWAVEHIDVAIDLATLDGVTTFNRTIQVKGQLTNEQKQRLAEVADKCPIHKVLNGTIRINTILQ